MLRLVTLSQSFVIVSDAGEKGKDAAQHVNLFVDITKNRPADEIDISKKRRLDLAGVPVMVGGARGRTAPRPALPPELPAASSSISAKTFP